MDIYNTKLIDDSLVFKFVYGVYGYYQLTVLIINRQFIKLFYINQCQVSTHSIRDFKSKVYINVYYFLKNYLIIASI